LAAGLEGPWTLLLQRLYVPAGGRVLIDGVDIGQIDPAWLRRQIGVVLQENILFSRSVRENIALANPAMPFDAVTAAEFAGAHEFIVRMSQGYDAIIEERGTNLSGGPSMVRRQRLASSQTPKRLPHPPPRRWSPGYAGPRTNHLLRQWRFCWQHRCPFARRVSATAAARCSNTLIFPRRPG
jgi:hypothetical protein